MALVKCKECGAEVSTKAKACPKCGAEIKVTSGCAMSAAIFLVAVLGIAIFGSMGKKEAPSAAPAIPAAKTAEQEAQETAQLEECRSNLVKSQQFGLLKDMEWKLPKSPRVVIGPRFYTMSFDEKEVFARNVSCFLLAGDQTKAIAFDLLDWRTEKVAAKWKYRKLIVE